MGKIKEKLKCNGMIYLINYKTKASELIKPFNKLINLGNNKTLET